MAACRPTLCRVPSAVPRLNAGRLSFPDLLPVKAIRGRPDDLGLSAQEAVNILWIRRQIAKDDAVLVDLWPAPASESPDLGNHSGHPPDAFHATATERLQELRRSDRNGHRRRAHGNRRAERVRKVEPSRGAALGH